MQSTNLPSIPVLIVASLGGVSALLANLISIRMIEGINKNLPAGKQLSYFWWGSEIRKEFKRQCPSSKLVLLRDFCLFLMILCFAFVVKFWVFG
jgi:hypothetical protein